MLLQSKHPRLEEIRHCLKHFLNFILDEVEETMQMQGEDERREDNTATGEEETTFTTNTQVSNSMCHGHHISASVLQMSSPGASTSDVIINIE